MTHALLIIDVQRDFTERIPGGEAVARGISEHLRETPGRYDVVIASRDWHDAVGDNGGHFPASPPGSADPYLRHCVAGSRGAQYDPALTVGAIDVHVRKGMGVPGYSIFEGLVAPGEVDDAVPGPVAEGTAFPEAMRVLGVDEVTVVGLATDHCVRAAALDALAAGCDATVLGALCAGTTPARAEAVLEELRAAGVRVR
ncbi:MAG: isochorismatase family protein [Microbacteriaceae bacterium]